MSNISTNNRLSISVRIAALMRSRGYSKPIDYYISEGKIAPHELIWLKDGVGTAYAIIKPCDIKSAINCLSVEEVRGLGCEDLVTYLTYLFSLVYIEEKKGL